MELLVGVFIPARSGLQIDYPLCCVEGSGQAVNGETLRQVKEEMMYIMVVVELVSSFDNGIYMRQERRKVDEILGMWWFMAKLRWSYGARWEQSRVAFLWGFWKKVV